MLLDVGSCVAKWGEDQDTLFVGNSFRCRGNRVEVDVSDCRVVDLDWFVVVEYDWSLQMRRPECGLVGGHVHWWFGWTEAVEPGKVWYQYVCLLVFVPSLGGLLLPVAYFCISSAVPLRPRHKSTINPPSATKSRKRVFVRKYHIALVGGNRALADFHVMPPFGYSIVN